MKYLIRKAKRKDAKGIHEVLLAAFEEFRYYYSPEGFHDTVLTTETVLKRIKSMTIFIAIDQNDFIIGTIGWKKLGSDEGHIRGMAVHPDLQGKGNIATDLLTSVENDARFHECSFLTLDTTEVLQRAQNFYRKNGFEKTGKIGDFFGSTIFEFKKRLNTE